MLDAVPLCHFIVAIYKLQLEILLVHIVDTNLVVQFVVLDSQYLANQSLINDNELTIDGPLKEYITAKVCVHAWVLISEV